MKNLTGLVVLAFVILFVGCDSPEDIRVRDVHNAALAGEVDNLRQLLAAGADVNAEWKGNPPLYSAVSVPSRKNDGRLTDFVSIDKRRAVVRMLLDAKADVNARGGTELTVLMNAAWSGGDDEIINMLLDAGADVKAVDDKGNTASDWAFMGDHIELSRRLRQRAR